MKTLTKLKLALLQSGRFSYEVGEKCKITETKMSRLVVGRGTPTLAEAKSLSKELKVKVSDLFDKFAPEVRKKKKVVA